MRDFKDLKNGCYLLILTFTMLFFNCSNYINVLESNKTKHISGLKNGKNYVDYTFKFESDADFIFKSLALDSKIITEMLYIKNLKTRLSSTKIKSAIQKGKYMFGFRVFDTSNFNTEEKLTFKYSVKGKEYQIEQTIKKQDRVINNK